jgi:hypothetical protein
MTPRQAWRAVRRMGPFLLSHHPSCGPFRADVLRVAGRDWCTACFVGYPALAVAAAGAWWLRALLPWWGWILVGLLVASPQALSFAGRVPSVRVQVAVKLALGAGFGMVLAGLLMLPLAWGWRLAAVVVGMMALQSLWVLRFHRLERTCQSCPQLPLRPRCEGLRELDARVGTALRPGWVQVEEKA